MRTTDPYANLAELYDSFAKDDSIQAFYREWRDSLLAAIQKYKVNVRVLVDLACGTGNSTIPWTKQREWTVIGVDRSSAMLREAKKKSSRVQWYRQDLTKLDVTVQERAFSTSEIRQMLKKASLQLLKQETQRKLEGKSIRIVYLARRRPKHYGSKPAVKQRLAHKR